MYDAPNTCVPLQYKAYGTVLRRTQKVQENDELTAASGTLMRKPVCMVTVERSHRACDRLEVPRPCIAAKVNRIVVKGQYGQINMA